MSATADTAKINTEIVTCQKCTLANTRKYAVPGEGPIPANIMFIGEGPGYHENETGRPFVGNAGQLLTDLLEKIGLRREDVFITNVVKCRPPKNRDPKSDEISACAGYLLRQIELVDPRVVVTLGRFSMARWFPDALISRIHGQPKRVGNRLVVAMFHPAAALHQQKYRPLLEADFGRLPDWIARAEAFRADDEGATHDIGQADEPPGTTLRVAQSRPNHGKRLRRHDGL